jgi:hypothetical protein
VQCVWNIRDLSESERSTHIIEKSSSISGYTLYRISLNECESSIVQLREVNLFSFEEIGRRLGITDLLARAIYIDAKRVQENRLLSHIKEKTGTTISDLKGETFELTKHRSWKKADDYIREKYAEYLDDV